MRLKVAANFAASGSGAGKIEPIAGWVSCTARHNIDDLATFKFIVQGHHARHQAITFCNAARVLSDNACTRAPISYLRVDAVGKVQRRRANGQVFHLTFGREHKDLLLEDIVFDCLDKLGIAGRV